MVARVRDVYVAARVHRHPTGVHEAGGGREPTVARKGFGPVSGHGEELAGRGHHHADPVGLRIGDVQIASRIQGDLTGIIEPGAHGRLSLHDGSRKSSSGVVGEDARAQRHLANAATGCDVEVAEAVRDGARRKVDVVRCRCSTEPGVDQRVSGAGHDIEVLGPGYGSVKSRQQGKRGGQLANTHVHSLGGRQETASGDHRGES